MNLRMFLLWITTFAHSAKNETTPATPAVPISVFANEHRCGRYLSLHLADPQYTKDDKFKFTDDHGNCRCPPEHLCYTTHQLEELTGMQRDGVAGSKDIEEKLEEVKKKMKLIIGCPIVGPELINWKTSRTAYNWQAKTAVCRAVSASSTAHHHPAFTQWRMFLTGMAIMGAIIMVILFSRYRRPIGQHQFLAHPVPSHLGAPPPTDRRFMRSSQPVYKGKPRASGRSRSESPPASKGRNVSPQPGRSMGGWKPKGTAV